MTKDELYRLMENYKTTDLLAVVDNLPLRLYDKVYEFHYRALQICNMGNAEVEKLNNSTI